MELHHYIERYGLYTDNYVNQWDSNRHIQSVARGQGKQWLSHFKLLSFYIKFPLAVLTQSRGIA